MVFSCDICGRGYCSKRNMRRHVKERHLRVHKFMCPSDDCRIEFIRRSYVTIHLTKLHKYTQLKAREIVKCLQPVSLNEKRNNVENPHCVSSDEYSDVSSLDEWLDTQLEYRNNDDSGCKDVKMNSTDDGCMYSFLMTLK